jgi:hypothetical protein
LRTFWISFADVDVDDIAFDFGKLLDLGVGGGAIEGNDLTFFAFPIPTQ